MWIKARNNRLVNMDAIGLVVLDGQGVNAYGSDSVSINLFGGTHLECEEYLDKLASRLGVESENTAAPETGVVIASTLGVTEQKALAEAALMFRHRNQDSLAYALEEIAERFGSVQPKAHP